MAQVTRIIPPAEWTKRQIDNIKAVGQKSYSDGITRPRKDPIEAAIAAEDKYAARMKEAIDERRRVRGLQGVTMQDWTQYAQNIGANRLVEGVTKREAKVDKFVRSFQPLLAGHVDRIDSMPAVTASDMEQRMLENLRGLKGLKGQWRGR